VKRLLLIPLLGAALAGCGSGTTASEVGGGDAATGHDLIVHYGCGACHRIDGVEGADGRVGPSLRDVEHGGQIAGKLANTPANAVRWIMDPQAISPGSDMPDLGLTRDQARDVVAYLYGG
jgi:cytochrome c2